MMGRAQARAHRSDARIQPLQPFGQPCCKRTASRLWRTQYTATADKLGFCSRTRHDLMFPVRSVRILISNAKNLGLPNDNAVTFKASVDHGWYRQPVFFNGQASVTLAPGASMFSDPVQLVNDPPMTDPLFVRLYSSVAQAGHKIPTYKLDVAVDKASWADQVITPAAVGVAPASDWTDDATAPTSAICVPIAVFGEPARGLDTPSIGLMGDSILCPADSIELYNYAGMWRAPLITAGLNPVIYGEAGQGLGIAAYDQLWRHVLSGCRVVISEWGRNDMGNTVSANKAKYLSLWRTMADMGIRVLQTTVTPQTTSTDSWATTQNQTVASAAQEVVRREINDWIRSCPAPLAGYLEFADVMESARDSGVWKAGYTSDGTHPNATGVLAGAAWMAQQADRLRSFM